MSAEVKQPAEMGFIDRFFSITKRQTRIRTEILAGVSIYLSLAYIFIVNPAILSKAGMSVSAVFFATIVASAATTLFMGLYARLPFALAPGLEINGFVAFVAVGTWDSRGKRWVQWFGPECCASFSRFSRFVSADSSPTAIQSGSQRWNLCHGGWLRHCKNIGIQEWGDRVR